ncbi:MAG: hypothetical protein RUMPE_00775 [Eubacteriales bacterium SKADARSKE-1]|nr:hypothetical protein [Eubacteriales bacterium SKADARSKE-1]MDQ5983736.1 hypothetical protein [Eubacteriales bacterium SKADARSKE-1]MDQ5983748.1 hypothetical protein [Eubacteriales bacterium SKADARSKE-1]
MVNLILLALVLILNLFYLWESIKKHKKWEMALYAIFSISLFLTILNHLMK